MERVMVYTISGCPIPLARIRFSGRRVYDEQSHLKIILRQSLINQHNGNKRYSGPLHLYATFYMQPPKRNSQRLIGKFHYYRPDIDNLLKMLCDLCNDILFDDDCCISQCTCAKIYDLNPRTEFYFKELHG